MIKEKLLFYNDYSSINKKCFSCQQFNHIIEECPKLHFVPNIEKIIKTYNYPHLSERADFQRNKNRSINALSIVKNNAKGYNKFKKRLKTIKTIEQKNDSSSDSDSNVDDNLEENDDEIKSFNETNSTNNNTKSLKAEKNDIFQLSNSKSLSNDDEINLNEEELKNSTNSYNLQKIPTKTSQKRKEYLSKHSESFNKTIKKENPIDSMTNSQNQTQFAAPKNDFEIDRVYNFKNYFPNFNIENLIIKYSKLINNEKEINRRYIKKKYSNFKYYTFYTNGILSKFLNEAKIRKKNRKSLCSNQENKKEINSPSINPLIRRRKSFYPLNLKNKSPLKKKTYFGKSENEEQIKSFADLINTLVQQNRKSKLENKIPNKS